MATYILNETVAGSPLFVPDAHDHFSIGAAAMPNGDDSLEIAGDVSTDYKAFCPSPSVTPEMFTSRDYATVLQYMSITFWVKMSVPTWTGSAHVTSQMFGVYNNTTQPSSTSDGSWLEDGCLWRVNAGGTSGVDNMITMGKTSAGSGGGASAAMTSLAITDDTWTLVTCNPSRATDGGIFLNDDVTGDDWSSSGEGTFSSDSISLPHFCIGNYQDGAYTEARNGAWELGKLAFHDHHLNITERTALYNTMMGL